MARPVQSGEQHGALWSYGCQSSRAVPLLPRLARFCGKCCIGGAGVASGPLVRFSGRLGEMNFELEATASQWDLFKKLFEIAPSVKATELQKECGAGRTDLDNPGLEVQRSVAECCNLLPSCRKNSDVRALREAVLAEEEKLGSNILRMQITNSLTQSIGRLLSFLVCAAGIVET